MMDQRRNFLLCGLLWIYFIVNVQTAYGSDEHEHVHIKVHMHDVVRKKAQYHHHRQQQQQQHHHNKNTKPNKKRPQPFPYHAQQLQYAQYPRTSTTPQTSETSFDLGAYFTKGFVGDNSVSHLAPLYPTQLPNTLMESDLAQNYGPVLFNNDIMPDKSPISPPPTTASALATSLTSSSSSLTPNIQPQIPSNKQFLQQLYTSADLMNALMSTSSGGIDGPIDQILNDNHFLNDYLEKYKAATQLLQSEMSTQKSSVTPLLQEKRKNYGRNEIREDYLRSRNKPGKILPNRQAQYKEFYSKSNKNNKRPHISEGNDEALTEEVSSIEEEEEEEEEEDAVDDEEDYDDTQDYSNQSGYENYQSNSNDFIPSNFDQYFNDFRGKSSKPFTTALRQTQSQSQSQSQSQTQSPLSLSPVTMPVFTFEQPIQNNWKHYRKQQSKQHQYRDHSYPHKRQQPEHLYSQNPSPAIPQNYLSSATLTPSPSPSPSPPSSFSSSSPYASESLHFGSPIKNLHDTFPNSDEGFFNQKNWPSQTPKAPAKRRPPKRSKKKKIHSKQKRNPIIVVY